MVDTVSPIHHHPDDRLRHVDNRSVRLEVFAMREEYDFSQSVPNPYAKKLKKQVTIRLEEDVVDYFRELSEETEIPYQTLIHPYLKDCVKSQRKLSLEWVN